LFRTAGVEGDDDLKNRSINGSFSAALSLRRALSKKMSNLVKQRFMQPSVTEDARFQPYEVLEQTYQKTGINDKESQEEIDKKVNKLRIQV
jgi:hypothetical protein